MTKVFITFSAVALSLVLTVAMFLITLIGTTATVASSVLSGDTPGQINTSITASGSTVWVHGGYEPIQVDASLEANLSALLAAARADGYLLGGWGYRDHMRQHELRRINGCPNDGSWTHTDGENPANWRSASSCNVPTARPGSSQHEIGLAVDFTCAGQPMGGSSCFGWLQKNAARFGLYNLASEPWHWSTTGR